MVAISLFNAHIVIPYFIAIDQIDTAASDILLVILDHYNHEYITQCK